MDILLEIVRSLLVIIIVSSFLEVLLPDGSVKPFVRFAIGLFVLLAILNPVLSFLHNDKNFKIDFWDYKADSSLEKEIMDNGQELNEQIVGQNTDFVKQKIEGQISAVVMLVAGVEDVATTLELNNKRAIERLQLLIKMESEDINEVEGIDVLSASENEDSNDTEEIEVKIIKLMKNLYNIDQDRIDIQFEGG